MNAVSAPSGPAPGFRPLFRSSPFLDLNGPFYCRQDQADATLVLGVRILNKHCNVSGSAHGGLLGTLADIALGYATAFSREPPIRMSTIHLSLDYSGAAQLGDWLEVHTQIQKIGRRLAFANARILCGETSIAGASAVFHIQDG